MATFRSFSDGTAAASPHPELVSVLLGMIRLCPESVRGMVRCRDGSAGHTSALELACLHCPHPDIIAATIDACPLALCDGLLGLLIGLPPEVAPTVKSEAFVAFLAVLEAALHETAKGAVPKSIRRGIREILRKRRSVPAGTLALGGYEVARAVEKHVHGDDREKLRSKVLGGEAVQNLLGRKDFQEFVLGIYRMNRAGRSGYESVRYPGFPPRIPGGRAEGGGAEEASAAERLKCVACLDAERTQAFWPCGHVCACDDCASWILGFDDEAKCPCCRSHVVSCLKVYLS
jgi:hypothetical protein